MRVGDLDALKKEVENLVAGGAEGLKDYYENGTKSDERSWIGGVYDAWELICNAKTIETSKIERKAYNEGFKDGVEQGIKLSEGRKGEWIDYSEEGFVECPFCHKATTCEDNIDELHYCWNCGAKMKGGKEE